MLAYNAIIRHSQLACILSKYFQKTNIKEKEKTKRDQANRNARKLLILLRILFFSNKEKKISKRKKNSWIFKV